MEKKKSTVGYHSFINTIQNALSVLEFWGNQFFVEKGV